MALAVATAPTPVVVPSKQQALFRGERLAGWLFASPWPLGFILFTAAPMLGSLGLTFFRWNLISPPTFVGVHNYSRLLHDGMVAHSLLVTTLYAVLSVPTQLIVALFLATLLHQRIRAKSFFRTVLYIPVVISGVAVALLWEWIFAPQVGLLNTILSWLGISGPAWLGNPSTALIALAIMSLWGCGGSVVLFLAGLQGVPSDLLDAAKVDGATPFRSFKYITMPLLSPLVLYVFVTQLIGALQTFTQPYVMTQGGPDNATMFYMLYLYQSAFQSFRIGYASALAWLLFIYILLLTALVFRGSAAWIYYEAAFTKRSR